LDTPDQVAVEPPNAHSVQGDHNRRVGSLAFNSVVQLEGAKAKEHAKQFGLAGRSIRAVWLASRLVVGLLD
jgi:hypothetical protein